MYVSNMIFFLSTNKFGSNFSNVHMSIMGSAQGGSSRKSIVWYIRGVWRFDRLPIFRFCCYFVLQLLNN